MTDTTATETTPIEQARRDWAEHMAGQELDAEAAALGDGGKAILDGYDRTLAELEARATTAERERDAWRARAEAAEGADKSPQTSSGAPEPASAGPGSSDEATGVEESDDETPGSIGPDAIDERIQQAHREAAKYRRQLRAVEKERDDAVDLLARTRQQMLDDAITRAGGDPGIVAYDGHGIDEFLTENGTLDLGQVPAIVAEVNARHGIVKPRRPDPVPGLGSVTSPRPALTGQERFASAFKRTSST